MMTYSKKGQAVEEAIEQHFAVNEQGIDWFITAAMVGVHFLPGNLEGVHATYLRVMLITTVVVPGAVATITLLVTFWLTSNPNGRSNWITGLSVANVSMLVCLLVVYGALQGGAGGTGSYLWSMW